MNRKKEPKGSKSAKSRSTGQQPRVLWKNPAVVTPAVLIALIGGTFAFLSQIVGGTKNGDSPAVPLSSRAPTAVTGTDGSTSRSSAPSNENQNSNSNGNTNSNTNNNTNVNNNGNSNVSGFSNPSKLNGGATLKEGGDQIESGANVAPAASTASIDSIPNVPRCATFTGRADLRQSDSLYVVVETTAVTRFYFFPTSVNAGTQRWTADNVSVGDGDPSPGQRFVIHVVLASPSVAEDQRKGKFLDGVSKFPDDAHSVGKITVGRTDNLSPCT